MSKTFIFIRGSCTIFLNTYYCQRFDIGSLYSFSALDRAVANQSPLILPLMAAPLSRLLLLLLLLWWRQRRERPVRPLYEGVLRQLRGPVVIPQQEGGEVLVHLVSLVLAGAVAAQTVQVCNRVTKQTNRHVN